MKDESAAAEKDEMRRVLSLLTNGDFLIEINEK
jgi:hypothetical protein